MMKKFKEFMNHPYTRGDYYGGIAAMMALYTVVGIMWWKRYKDSVNTIESIGQKDWEDDDESEDGA